MKDGIEAVVRNTPME